MFSIDCAQHIYILSSARVAEAPSKPTYILQRPDGSGRGNAYRVHAGRELSFRTHVQVPVALPKLCLEEVCARAVHVDLVMFARDDGFNRVSVTVTETRWRSSLRRAKYYQVDVKDAYAHTPSRRSWETITRISTSVLKSKPRPA